MAHHVHRTSRLGAWVLINERWYKILKETSDYLAAQTGIEASFEGSNELVTRELEKIQFNSSGDMLFVRSNKLRIRARAQGCPGKIKRRRAPIG
jgi:hypothetical protein